MVVAAQIEVKSSASAGLPVGIMYMSCVFRCPHKTESMSFDKSEESEGWIKRSGKESLKLATHKL